MDGEVILSFLPGAAQGFTTVVLGHPLDTAKTRMQAMGSGASRFFLVTMWNMASAEGVRSLYRGVTPPLLMSSTKRSLQFAIWDIVRKYDHSRTSSDSCSSYIHDKSSEVLTWIGASPFRTGAVAGGFGTFIGCPMQVIKIQTQFLTHNMTRNAWTCACDIYRKKGIGGYYCGFRYHLLKDMCFASCYLGLYDEIKQWLRGHYEEHTQPKWSPHIGAVVGNSPEFFTSQLAFIAGGISSMTTWLLFYPLDTIKTIVQARDVGIVQVAEMFRREMSVVYRGLGASLVRAGPVSGAAMVVYEMVKGEKDKALLLQR